MARRRWFYGKSQEWLEAELAKAQADMAAGSASTGGTEGDASFTEQVAASPAERIDALLYELHCVDPAKYPAAVGKMSRKARVVFAS